MFICIYMYIYIYIYIDKCWQFCQGLFGSKVFNARRLAAQIGRNCRCLSCVSKTSSKKSKQTSVLLEALVGPDCLFETFWSLNMPSLFLKGLRLSRLELRHSIGAQLQSFVLEKQNFVSHCLPSHELWCWIRLNPIDGFEMFLWCSEGGYSLLWKWNLNTEAFTERSSKRDMASSLASCRAQRQHQWPSKWWCNVNWRHGLSPRKFPNIERVLP